MSIEDKAQAEANRLVEEIDQSQAKAKSPNAVKRAEAQKLIAEINRLQVAAIRDQDSEKARQAKAETKHLFETQFAYVRAKQQNAREQLNRLMQAKQRYDLVQKQGTGKPDPKLQQQLLQLIKAKKEEFVRLNQEADTIRQQAQQKSIILGETPGSFEHEAITKAQAENTSLTERAKAEAEKLISEVTRQKPKDSSDKAEEVGKMIAEINRLQMAAEQGILSENETAQLEERIKRVESKQRESRDQINQLTQAKIKYELALARSAKAKDEEKTRRAQDEKLQKELNSLIQKKEDEQRQLMQELELIRMRSEQEAALLKAQRDAARALAEQQSQDDDEDKPRSGKNKLLLVMLVLLILTGIGVGGFFAMPQLKNLLNPLQTSKSESSPAATPASRTNVEKTQKPELAPESSQPEASVSKVRPGAEFADRLLTGGQGPVMIQLPSGSFLMGSPDYLPYSDERPQFQVTLQGFSIGKYEVTFDDYQKFARAASRRFPDDNHWGQQNRPVVNVTWDEANDYTQWLTQQTGKQYRLPSEREWEYAARAGTTGQFWWGNRLDKSPVRANCGVCGSEWDGIKTAPIGQFPANDFGLHDVIGNVMEWTRSCYHVDYAGAPAIGNIWESNADCTQYMVRSSAFNTYKRDIRITRRQPFNPKSRANNLGFRVLRVD